MVAVQTRGRESNTHWMTLYRLEYSTSTTCDSFNALLDDFGNNVVSKIDKFDKF